MATCVRDGCRAPAESLDQCWAHYLSFRRMCIREGSWEPRGRRPHAAPRQRCERCSKQAVLRGLCYRHWVKDRAQAIQAGTWRTSQSKPAGVERYQYEQPCGRAGCQLKARTHGLCETHYKQWLRLQKTA